MTTRIAIIDYGMGNLHSIYRKIRLLGAQPIVTSEPSEILEANKIILPGVGCFEKAISNLKHLKIYDTLNEAVLVKKMPILGICLGMQLMAEESEEGHSKGFGWISTQVKKFKVQDTIKFKVPQTGWNTIGICKSSRLLQKIENDSEFYFLHSYHYMAVDPSTIIAKTEYEYEFVSAIEKDNFFGTQFHPEKSHTVGEQLLQNFIHI